MPRVIRNVHEYYEDRIVWGFDVSIVPHTIEPENKNKNAIRISPGGAVLDRKFVEMAVECVVDCDEFILDGNMGHRTDLIVLDLSGQIQVIHGESYNEIYSEPPVQPPLTLLLVQLTVPKGWGKFYDNGAGDGAICPRSQHVIDTRFVAP